MEQQSSQKAIIALGSWLETAAGQYVRAWEQAQLDALTADIFGFHAMQIGLPQVNALQASRMPHQWLSDSILMHGDATLLPAPARAPAAPAIAVPQVTPAQTRLPVAVVLDYADLPFASQSLDLVVLPHVLEFAAEPHQVLREVERVLIPEGQLIVCGFNPTSLWGARQAAGRLAGGHFLPLDGEFISIPRMKDWLTLLNMEVNRWHFGGYAPPCNTERWLQRYAFMEHAGQRWWPYFGAVYMVQAIKRIKGMRLIGPAWKRPAISSGNAVAVTNRSRQE